MRPSVRRYLTGLLIAGALAFSAVGADAMGGGNGPDAFIGIINGGPHPYDYSSQGDGYRAYTSPGFDRTYRNRHGGQRPYNGGYNHGY